MEQDHAQLPMEIYQQVKSAEEQEIMLMQTVLISAHQDQYSVKLQIKDRICQHVMEEEAALAAQH